MTQTTLGNIPALLPVYYDRLLLDNLYQLGSLTE